MSASAGKIVFFSFLAACFMLTLTGVAEYGQGQQKGQKSGSVEEGKTLFEDKCAACHTIGGGRKAGPDLQGVNQKRKKEWLVDFITNPEHMLNEKNPVAMKLLNEYAGVRMPDTGLSKKQAEDVLAYIKQQSE